MYIYFSLFSQLNLLQFMVYAHVLYTQWLLCYFNVVTCYGYMLLV